MRDEMAGDVAADERFAATCEAVSRPVDVPPFLPPLTLSIHGELMARSVDGRDG